MRTKLDLNLVRTVLTFVKRPQVDDNGDVVRGPTGQVQFVLKEGSKEFESKYALKVSAKSKSYLIQKRVGNIKTELISDRDGSRQSDL